MRTILLPLLILLLQFAPSLPAADVNLDIWFVRDLLNDLSEDSFAVREQATQRLIAIGPAVLPEISLAADGARLDVETRERLERISREAEFAHMKTLSQAVAEYERVSKELAVRKPSDAGFKLLRERSERILERAEVLAEAEERDRALANLLSYTGNLFFRSPHCERHSATLRFAIEDLQWAMSCYDRHLKRHPDDIDAENAQRRTATLLGSALWMESPRFE